MRLIESICLLDGQLQRLTLHQQRVDRAFAEMFPNWPSIELAAFLNPQALPTRGTHKVRVVYSERGLEDITITPYEWSIPRRIGLVEAPDFIYPFKLADRRFFDDLFHLYPGMDEFIILHQGLITDSTYANIALKRKGAWLTPRACLLPGTRRQSLLDQRKIRMEDLQGWEAVNAEEIAFLNAMRGLERSIDPATLEFVWLGEHLE